MEIIEQYINSKTGNLEAGEDGIFFNEDFAAIIDGVTTKSPRRWNGLTTGQVACDLILKTLPKLAPEQTALEVFTLVNRAFVDFYENEGVLAEVEANPVERWSACLMLFSRRYRQIWAVGDCQALIDGKLYTDGKVSDDLLSKVRAFYLETELMLGKTIEELREHDTGRDFIFPLLQRERLFQNSPTSPDKKFGVLDGFLNPQTVRIIEVPPSTEFVVMASDGYPDVRPTLAESEQRLAEILASDPLFFREYKSTKGLQKGNVSFDDRSYLRLRLDDPNRD